MESGLATCNLLFWNFLSYVDDTIYEIYTFLNETAARDPSHPNHSLIFTPTTQILDNWHRAALRFVTSFHIPRFPLRNALAVRLP